MKYNLTALMKYLKDEFGGVNERLDEMQNSFSVLQSSVDKIAITTFNTTKELKIANSRLNNIENWAKQSAEKIGIKFKQ